MATYIHPTIDDTPLHFPHPNPDSMGHAITRDIMYEMEFLRQGMKDIRELMVKLDKRVRRIETELKIGDQKETEGRKLDLG